MVEHLGRLISDYGYWIVALFIFGEGMSIPFPTDTTLVTAAAFAARGRLSVEIVFLISTIATAAGTTIAFIAGRRGGEFFERHSRKMHPAVLTRTRGFFDRHGRTAVVVGRFIPFARMLISPLAGLSTMSLGTFTIYNAIGSAIWSAVFCGVGYFFGHHPPAMTHGIVRGAFGVAVGIAIVLTVVVAGGWLVEESDAAWRAEGSFWHRILMSAPVRQLASRSPAARAFLFRRFTPGDYLGLNLTLGLGLSFVTLIIFSAAIKAMITRRGVPEFDIGLLVALRETATPARDALWTQINRLGHFPTVALAGLTLGAIAAWRRHTWLPVIGVGGALSGSVLLDAFMKSLIARQPAAGAPPTPILMGTPSGQALTCLVGYGIVAYFIVLLVDGERIRMLVTLLALSLVLAVCFGRLYLGERYFSDIVSGLAAGGVWLSATLTGLEVARRRAEMAARLGAELALVPGGDARDG
ncbi:MAG TPA: VTT domain-containing protein [Gemmatimonadaceae bacterium]